MELQPASDSCEKRKEGGLIDRSPCSARLWRWTMTVLGEEMEEVALGLTLKRSLISWWYTGTWWKWAMAWFFCWMEPPPEEVGGWMDFSQPLDSSFCLRDLIRPAATSVDKQSTRFHQFGSFLLNDFCSLTLVICTLLTCDWLMDFF